MNDSNRSNGARPLPDAWQRDRDDKLDAAHDAKKLRDVVPEPDAGERERIKRAVFSACCSICGRNSGDGVLLISEQCMDCVDTWSRR